MNTDQILSTRAIDNPSDAALVRLVSAALTLPEESAETLCRRVNLTNKDDQTLAAAIVDAVRANTPKPQKRGSLWITLAALLLGVGVVSALLVRSEMGAKQLEQDMKEVQARADEKVLSLQRDFTAQLDKIRKEYVDAQSQAGTKLQGNLDTFTRTIAEQTQRINDLVRENEQVRQQLKASEATIAEVREKQSRGGETTRNP